MKWLKELFTPHPLVAPPVPLAALRDEISLLTTYSTDTIYRLRYDTMHYDYISPAVERLLGFTREEFQAVSFRELILETRIISNDLRAVESFAPYEASRKCGDVSKWQADYLMCRKDGTRIWVSDISYPWFNEQGAIIGSIGSLRDITERVEAETRAREELERLHNTDALTGLMNRAAFMVRLEEESRRIRRSFEDLAVLVIDIDFTQKVNADFGTRIGDLFIREVAKIIASCLRGTDVCARIGGDEFGLILPETPAHGAHGVAERIRMMIANQIFEFGDEHMMGCTASIGIASAQMDQHMDAETLLALADRRLQAAKRTGRNCVSMEEVSA